MKYRILSSEELKHLEEELKQFLIVNGVHAEEWERINSEEPDTAIDLVELFSDSVLQKVYEKVRFLEHRSKTSCLAFHAGKDEVEMISVVRKEGSNLDLSTPESIHHALLNHAGDIQLNRQSKPNNKSREEEIHQLLEQGCVPSSKEFWVSLEAITE